MIKQKVDSLWIDLKSIKNEKLCLWSDNFEHILSKNDNIIQIWHLGECNINFYCTLKNDIARGACAECNIIFQSAIKIDIARNQSAIFVLLYAYCSFK